MGRPCTICRHPKREEIDRALVRNEAGYRTVAARFGISASALFRHKREHLPALIAKGLEALGVTVQASSPDDAIQAAQERPRALSSGLQVLADEKAEAEEQARLAKLPPPPPPYAADLAKERRAMETRETEHAIDTFQQLRAINAACLEVLREARKDGKHSILLRAVDRIARQIELQAKLLGQIQDGATVNVAVLPEWHGIRQAVLDALQPYPEARLAVVRALKGAV